MFRATGSLRGAAVGPTPGRADERLLRVAARALHRAAFARALDGLVLDRPTRPATPSSMAPLLHGELGAHPHVVDLAVDAALRVAAFEQLTHGWTVAALHAFARPRLDEQTVRYLVDVLGLTAQWSAASAWFPELEDVGGRIWWTVGAPHAAQWAQRHDVDRPRLLQTAVELLALLIALPCTLDARPETPAAPTFDPGLLVRNDRAVSRIDALFAKAARSVFPEEAAAYAAKAQDLLVRHAGRPAAAVTAAATVTRARRPLPYRPAELRSA